MEIPSDPYFPDLAYLRALSQADDQLQSCIPSQLAEPRPALSLGQTLSNARIGTPLHASCAVQTHGHRGGKLMAGAGPELRGEIPSREFGPSLG